MKFYLNKIHHPALFSRTSIQYVSRPTNGTADSLAKGLIISVI